MIKHMILSTVILYSGHLFAGGAIGGAGGGGSSARVRNISLMRLDAGLGDFQLPDYSKSNGQIKEALVLPQDFNMIVHKSLRREPVTIDDQEFIGVGIDQDAQAVELAPSDIGATNLIVRPSN